MFKLELTKEKYQEMDIEGNLIREMPDIMRILLMDRTTRRNIIWATDSYASFGREYFSEEAIRLNLVTNGAGDLIKLRALKLKHHQENRTRDRAEVFTPIWIIKKQNDLIEKEFKNLSLEEYIEKDWLELACGEGPYIASRYDTETGEQIEIENRVGFLDRKIQRISEEIDEYEKWMDLVEIAYKSVFGYEFQGDSLLLARENLLYTFIDYYLEKFNKMPELVEIEEIAKIISYNIFQMDGLNYTIPLSKEVEMKNLGTQLSLLGDTDETLESVRDIKKGINVRIKNWINNRLIDFGSLTEEEGEKTMKFDVIIGNPPYQISDNDSGKGSAIPIYHNFIEEAININPNLISLITPSIWFTGGKGLTKFRGNMLNEKRFKLFHHFETPKDVFPYVSLRGGVNYFIWDSNFDNNKNGIYVRSQRGNNIVEGRRPYTIGDVDFLITTNVGISIIEKILEIEEISFVAEHESNLSGYISARNPFGFTTGFKRHKDFKTKPTDINTPVKVYASRGDIGYVENDLIEKNRDWINDIKLITPFANNIGTDLNDDNLNTIITSNNSIVTETYLVIGIGLVNSKDEILNLEKYLKTKIVRYLISLAKANQNGTRKTYQLVPLQDFTPESDIDWSQSITNIDKQLYKKYNLNEEEIEFIETNIREME